MSKYQNNPTSAHQRVHGQYNKDKVFCEHAQVMNRVARCKLISQKNETHPLDMCSTPLEQRVIGPMTCLHEWRIN